MTTHWIRPLDEDADVLRDGQRMRVPLLMRDHSTPSVAVADQLRSQQRGISVAQAGYENRLTDAWKQTRPIPGQGAAPAAVADRQASQAAYEQRIHTNWMRTT